MRHILHIFAKDSRRFWIEILLSLTVVAAFVLVYPASWNGHRTIYALGLGGFSYDQQRRMEIFANVLTGLVPLSWWLLITRVVHAESLVGDRQFWITRPIAWWKLLSAKLLFLLAYVLIPFFLSQWVLLMRAGFQLRDYVPGVLFNLLSNVTFMILPLMALAAVTKNFARMTLTLLASLIGILGISYLCYRYLAENRNTPGEDNYSLLLPLFVLCIAIVVQYAVRRVWLARMLLIALVLGFVGFGILPTSGMVEAAYPASRSRLEEPAQITLRRDVRQTFGASSDSPGDAVNVSFPIQVDGVATGHAVMLENARFSVESKNGAKWDSTWQVAYNQNFLPGQSQGSVQVKMSREAYERFKNNEVRLRLFFAVTEARDVEETHVELSMREVFIPHLGICPAGAFFLSRLDGGSGLACRAAMHGPDKMYVSAPWTSGPCKRANADPEKESKVAVSGEWIGAFSHEPAEFGMTPVWDASVWLSKPDNRDEYHLCPGEIVTVARYEAVRSVQVGLTAEGYRLPELDKGLSMGDLILQLK